MAIGCASLAPSGAGAAIGNTSITWVPTHVCGEAVPGKMACNAWRLEAHRTLGATTGTARVMASGPSGGFTPGQVAKAYGVDVTSATAATQTVAIIDAFADPSVKTDLAAFNAHYGIAAETATSFRVVNQLGATSPLPVANSGWAGEISLDVQAVRGLCHRCKILLIEANSNSNADLAAATNRAATMGATEISNSYGGLETDASHSASQTAAYNHPGIVVTASTGDDGWYNFDKVFDGGTSNNATQVPASLNTVIGVGGTSLYLNPDNTRASETVWNNNGPNARYANLAGRSLGAAGGGCSLKSTAKTFQAAVAGYGTLGCGAGMRSMTDIAAIADPMTGYDIYQTYGATTAGWQTYGGTSLASPVVAAMWALAGGSGGTTYPALSLYGHYKHDAAARPMYDVAVGGTGLCDTTSRLACSHYWGGNPNTLGFGLLDCGFAASGSATVANAAQCYAQPGYDGVSGVGTPKGVAGFKAMGPSVSITAPGTVTHGVSKHFVGSATDPFPGGAIASYVWHWGDGATSTGSAPNHTYAAAGARTITLVATDNYGRSGQKAINIVVN